VIPGKIEKEVVIEAPVDVVWRIVTEPQYISQWFSDDIEMDPQPNGAGVLKFNDDEGNPTKIQPFVVEAMDPMSRFAFRWCYDDGVVAATGNSLLVEFLLTEHESGTQLRMVETGFDEMPIEPKVAQDLYDDHVNGWSAIVPRIADVAGRSHD
jgi:uncharacterized protein YndB with AHSA1/START domain